MKPDYRQNPISLEWVVVAPHRRKRPDQHGYKKTICPFDRGFEKIDEEIMRIGGKKKTEWKIRVLKNLFPITEYHEVIIHSPKHNSSLPELPLEQVIEIFEVYQSRYKANLRHGYPLVFSNHGFEAGESLRHGHSQLAVIPPHIGVTSPLAQSPHNIAIKGKHLVTFCPNFSQFPYETWIQPLVRNQKFSDVGQEVLTELATTVWRVLAALDAIHPGLPYNFYIYPGEDWYLRIMGRFNRSPGGLELGSGVWVDVTDPKEVVKALA